MNQIKTCTLVGKNLFGGSNYAVEVEGDFQPGTEINIAGLQPGDSLVVIQPDGSRGNTFNVYQCQSCGVLFAQTREVISDYCADCAAMRPRSPGPDAWLEQAYEDRNGCGSMDWD